MKFLIQKINGEIKHDFAFTLLETVRFLNWYRKNDDIKVKFINAYDVVEPDDIYPMVKFKPFHKNYVPIGSNEFVTEFLQYFYEITPKPINVPVELYPYAGRSIFIDNESGIFSCIGKWFVKSCDKIKGFSELIDCDKKFQGHMPAGQYQYSYNIDIKSEWRAFVYQGKLVGLQNYSGEFTIFPEVDQIQAMIQAYTSAPIAYTLDVGVIDVVDRVKRLVTYKHRSTVIIEVHSPINSCGLYGFTNHNILAHMFYRSFNEFLQKNVTKAE